MSLERKTIGICVYDVEPTFAITYSVNSENIVEHLRFWIKEEFKTNVGLLTTISIFISKLNKPKKLEEKEIFINYQNEFRIETLYNNYQLSTKQYNNKDTLETQKPYLGFDRVTKQDINIIIKNYIEKGEIE